MIQDKASLNPPILGCDVGARELHFFATDRGETFACSNTLCAVKKVLNRFAGHIVAAEATGGYEINLIHMAAERKMVVYRLCGDRVAAHVRASGGKAKTDAMDARAIAEYVPLYHRKLIPFVLQDKAQLALATMSSRRDDLVGMCTAEKNRLQAPQNKPYASEIRRHIRYLKTAIAKIEGKIEKVIEDNDQMRLRKRVLTNMKGVGDKVATVLIACMPELGQINNKQAASTAGVAPHPRQSGNKDGYRRTGRGRRRIKSALHMAVLSAIRHDDKMKAFYDRLIKNGKPPLVAMTAVARKMIVIANAKIRDELKAKQS